MVKLPEQFLATRYPGYFWNTKDQWLYSMKIDGILKPIKKVYPNHFNHIHCPGFRVSVGGRRKFYPIDKLKQLTADSYPSTIPVLRHGAI